jgi:hypothetical protein
MWRLLLDVDQQDLVLSALPDAWKSCGALRTVRSALLFVVVFWDRENG